MEECTPQKTALTNVAPTFHSMWQRMSMSFNEFHIEIVDLHGSIILMYAKCSQFVVNQISKSFIIQWFFFDLKRRKKSIPITNNLHTCTDRLPS